MLAHLPTPPEPADRLAAALGLPHGDGGSGLMAMPRSDLSAVRAAVFLVTGGVPALFDSRCEDWLAGPDRPVVDVSPLQGRSHG